MKKFYAGIVLEDSELAESASNRIELEYYKTSKKRKIDFTTTKKAYGIEIVKREYIGNKKTKEKNALHNLTNNERIADNLLEILKQNKVTPIGLEDTVRDLFKESELRCNEMT